MGIADVRLYYNDSTRIEFSATVTDVQQDGERFRVRLDRTAFYPTSGGQPNDVGTLGHASVLDVVVVDNDVIHVVDKPFTVGSAVTGRIDWARRFDHMQQHCGQHVLSRCFELLYNLDTIGFHLGTDTSTVDLATSTLEWEQIRAAEDLANQVVYENRLIHARFVSDSELAALSLRRAPKVTQDVRIVSIEGFDDNACGGTHPRATGQLGQIRVLRSERMHQGLRLTFVCGNRALKDARMKQDVLRDISALLSTGQDELLDSLEKQQRDLQQMKKTEAALRSQVVEGMAERLYESRYTSDNGRQIICGLVDGVGGKDLKGLVQQLAKRMSGDHFAIGLICVDGERIHVQVQRSEHAHVDASEILKRTLTHIGGKGGGSAVAAQGSAPVEAGAVEELLGRLQAALLAGE